MKTVRRKPVVSEQKSSRAAAPAATATVQRATVETPRATEDGSHWTFLTNHSHVLLILAQNPNVVLREVALQVGITERAVQRIIADLEAARVIERQKIGRQNHYRIRTKQPLRHAITSHRTIGELLSAINGGKG